MGANKACNASGAMTGAGFARRLASVALAAALAAPAAMAWQPMRAAALDGVGGYDGTGISAGYVEGRTALDYQEALFVTGEPIMLKGTISISKSATDAGEVTALSYRLSNVARNVQLTRELEFATTRSDKGDGQSVTTTALSRDASEKIVTADETYTLRTMDFTRTSLADAQPAVSYYSGNTWYRKRYELGGGTSTAASGRFLTVEATGEFYGFDETWGRADVEETQFTVEYEGEPATAADGGEVGEGGGEVGGGGAEEGDAGSAAPWSGVAEVRRSQSTVTELRYVTNAPTAISFRGGFLETRKNDNVLEYTARMPEMAASGEPTDRIARYSDSASLSTFPTTRRLVSPDLRGISGHWAEESISKLFGLEILKDSPADYLPEQYITRAEFAAAVVAAAQAAPADPFLAAATRARRATANSQQAAALEPSFTDVPASHKDFAAIEEAFARGIMWPAAQNEFSPNATLTVADAAVAFIDALGLETLASPHGAVTEYADDAGIPAYAREALYAAQRIGLLRGDQQGNIYPSKALTKGEAAVMLDRLVEYMREDLRKDYRERLLDY